MVVAVVLMPAANEDIRLAADILREWLIGRLMTNDIVVLLNLCERLESGESIILPKAEVDALRASAKRLAASLASLVCGSCDNRIGWDGESRRDGSDWRRCVACREPRAALAMHREVDVCSACTKERK